MSSTRVFRSFGFSLSVLGMFSQIAFGSVLRTIDGDALKSADHSKTYTLPSATDTLVGRTTTDTLQNKTLDGGSSITTAVNFQDATDSTKQLSFSLSGNTTGKTLTLSTAQTNSQTLSIPNVGSGDSIATLKATQTLQNKTIDTTNTIGSGAATSGQALVADGAGGSSFQTVTASSSYDSPVEFENVGLAASVSSNNLTVALKQKDGSTDATAGSPAKLGFRSTSLTTGGYNRGTISADLSITANSGASFGLVSAQAQYIFVYAQYNAGTVELCLAGSRIFDVGLLQTTTTISSSATSASVLYCSTGRSSQPITYLGRIAVNEATAGTYASAPTEVSIKTSLPQKSLRSEVWVDTANGYGSTANKYQRFTNTDRNIGSAITYADSSANGASFTINEDGMYSAEYNYSGDSQAGFGVLRNTSVASGQSPGAVAVGKRLCTSVVAAGLYMSCSVTFFSQAGDIIYAGSDGVGQTGFPNMVYFRIVKVSD